MQQEPINEAVVRKIQNLLNLGSRAAGNEQEAAAAMAKAQELLAKYNLDLYVVQNTRVQGGAVAAQTPEKREKTKIDKSAMYQWQRQLCCAIAEANFCFYWYREYLEPYHPRNYPEGMNKNRRVKRHVILGRQANVIAVTNMYEYLVETIERIVPYPNVERLSKSAISWREGCAHRLIERIQRKAQEMQAEKSQSTGEATTTAIVLQSVVKAEYAANYDAVHGEGAYAKMLQRHAEWDKEAEEKRKQKAIVLANETPAQRRQREAEEAKAERQWQKARKREERRQQRAWLNKDIEAYYSGREVGDKIGLNEQISTCDQSKLGGK